MTVDPMRDRVQDFAALIADPADDAGFAALRAAENAGRQLGTQDFIDELERVPGRRVARTGANRQSRQVSRKACSERGILVLSPVSGTL